MIYVIVGTYKTLPEKEGWYIKKKYDKLLWNKFNLDKYKFKVKAKEIELSNNYKRLYGEVSLQNGSRIIFYDLLNFRQEIYEKEIYSDNRIFRIEKFRNEMLLGAKYFHEFLNKIRKSDFIRVGFIGERSESLIKFESFGLNGKFKALSTYKKYTKALKLESSNNIEYMSLFPITGRYTIKELSKDKSWNVFFKELL